MRCLAVIGCLLLVSCVQVPNPQGPQDMAGGSDAGDMRSMPDQGPNNDDGDPDADSDMGPSQDQARFSSIAISQRAVCVLERATRNVYCWGTNFRAQLGEFVMTLTKHPPFQRVDFPPFEMLTAGRSHMCGHTGTEVYCWGDNLYRQGDSNSAEALPEPSLLVTSSSGTSGLAAGSWYTCATSNQASQCWGVNGFGVFDASSTNQSCLPGAADGQRCPETGPAMGRCLNEACRDFVSGMRIADALQGRVVGGDEHLCILTENGQAHCWGNNGDGRAVPGGPQLVTGPTLARTERFIDLDASTFTCGIADDRVVKCWGSPDNQQTGVTEGNPLPNVKDAVEVAVGASHGCARRETGAVSCWGRWAESKPTTAAEFEAPTGTFLAIGAGKGVTCASTETDLYCWGNNAADGLVGQFDDDTPIQMVFEEPTRVPIN